MLVRHLVIRRLSIALWILCAGGAFGQSYPSKPVRIVTGPAGGGQDLFARIIGDGISGPLAQPIVIDNRPTAVYGELVAKSPPDGYTLLLGGAVIMFGPLLRPAPYDVMKDFSSLTSIDVSPNVLVVHPSLPVKSVKDLIALAKAKPGELNYSMAGPGGGIHLAAELLKSMTGTNIVGVAYKGSAAALNGLMGGEVHMMFTDVSAMPHIKAGRVRALGVSSLEPSGLYPGIPTVASSGLPGFEIVGIDAMWAPAATPAPIVNRLNQEIVRVLNRPDVRAKFFETGAESAPCSPAELDARVRADVAKMAKLIKDAGIKLQ